MEGTEQPSREGYVFAVREEAAWLEAGDEKPEVVPPFNLAENPPRTRALWFWANWIPDGHKAR